MLITLFKFWDDKMPCCFTNALPEEMVFIRFVKNENIKIKLDQNCTIYFLKKVDISHLLREG